MSISPISFSSKSKIQAAALNPQTVLKDTPTVEKFCRSNAQIDAAARELCSSIVETFLTSWYQQLTPNRNFQSLVTAAIAQVCKNIEDRALRVKWGVLFLIDVPELLEAHYSAYARSMQPRATALHALQNDRYFSSTVNATSSNSVNSDSLRDALSTPTTSMDLHSQKPEDFQAKTITGQRVTSPTSAFFASESPLSTHGNIRRVQTPTFQNQQRAQAYTTPNRNIPSLIAEHGSPAVTSSFLPPLHTGVGDGPSLSPSELAFHAQLPHIAMTNAEIQTAALPNLEEYLRHLSTLLCKSLCPDSVVESPAESILIREILVMVLGDLLEKWSNPDNLFTLLIDLLQPYSRLDNLESKSVDALSKSTSHTYQGVINLARYAWLQACLVFKTMLFVFRTHFRPWAKNKLDGAIKKYDEGYSYAISSGFKLSLARFFSVRPSRSNPTPSLRHQRKWQSKRKSRQKVKRPSNLDIPITNALKSMLDIPNSPMTWIFTVWDQLIRPPLRHFAGLLVDSYLETLVYETLTPRRISELLDLITEAIKSCTDPQISCKAEENPRILKFELTSAILNATGFQYECVRDVLQKHTLDALSSQFLNKHLILQLVDTFCAHLLALELIGYGDPARDDGSVAFSPIGPVTLQKSQAPSSNSETRRTDAITITRRRQGNEFAVTSLTPTLAKGITMGRPRSRDGAPINKNSDLSKLVGSL